MKKRRRAGALQISAVRFIDYSSIIVLIPAVNCWAIVDSSAGADSFSSSKFLPFAKQSFTITTMVTITFPDRDTEKRALAFMLGRFSGRVLRSGEHIVPEAALEALADQDIPFSARDRSTSALADE
jgi:hypothetical protein